MRKIVLVCAAGMSTSMLVKKMQEASAAMNYETDIAAYPIGEVDRQGQGADIILLGPQVRFQLKGVKEKYPNVPVEAIDMAAYGMMDGKKVIAHVKEVLGD